MLNDTTVFWWISERLSHWLYVYDILLWNPQTKPMKCLHCEYYDIRVIVLVKQECTCQCTSRNNHHVCSFSVSWNSDFYYSCRRKCLPEFGRDKRKPIMGISTISPGYYNLILESNLYTCEKTHLTTILEVCFARFRHR